MAELRIINLVNAFLNYVFLTCFLLGFVLYLCLGTC